jgi:hypothetical protein
VPTAVLTSHAEDLLAMTKYVQAVPVDDRNQPEARIFTGIAVPAFGAQ